MVDFEEIINTRRSIREYQPKDVDDEDILKMLNIIEADMDEFEKFI